MGGQSYDEVIKSDISAALLSQKTYDITENRKSSWCQLCHHWWHQRLSYMTTSGATSDDKVGIMMTCFSVIGIPGIHTYDNLWCHQWWQSWHRDDLCFSDWYSRHPYCQPQLITTSRNMPMPNFLIKHVWRNHQSSYHTTNLLLWFISTQKFNIYISYFLEFQ